MRSTPIYIIPDDLLMVGRLQELPSAHWTPQAASERGKLGKEATASPSLLSPHPQTRYITVGFLCLHKLTEPW